MILYVTANHYFCRERKFMESSSTPNLYKKRPKSILPLSAYCFSAKKIKCLRITDTLKLGYYIANSNCETYIGSISYRQMYDNIFCLGDFVEINRLFQNNIYELNN